MTSNEFVSVWRNFNDLTTEELYQILKLRQAIFIVEQKCPYYDIDGLDRECMHLIVNYKKISECVATLRIVPPRKSYDGPSIGRVAVDIHYQGQGLGRKIMEEAIKMCEKNYPGLPIHLGAQRYLKSFYESLGFEDKKQPYTEDGIPHLYMVKPGR